MVRKMRMNLIPKDQTILNLLIFPQGIVYLVIDVLGTYCMIKEKGIIDIRS